MAAMMLMLTMHAAVVKIYCIITTISWPPPLISQLFHAGIL